MIPPRMRLMPRRPRPFRPGRRHFEPEGLEPRHLLSVALQGIVATQPADGATPLQAPPSFTITFDQSVVDQITSQLAQELSIDPAQILPMIVSGDTGQDIEIDQIGPDGTVTPYLGANSATPVLLETLTTATDTDGRPQTQLVVSLPPGSPTMGPGTYQLDIAPQTGLDWAFSVNPNLPWASANQPTPIARFTVLGQGPTLAGATNLGLIGPQSQSVPGYLNPGNYQSAVAFYRFTLPAGQLWQLDAKALSQSIGSDLEPSLTLFDSDGKILATSDSGNGSTLASSDPQIVTGLGQGTYYLGVSASGNTPGYDYGYDPITGRPGTVGVNQAPGRFVVDLSATPIVPSTTLVNFNLDHADSLEPSPTGLDLTFSGPVDVSSLTQTTDQETALTVVDAAGRTWPISYVDYQASQDRLSLIFNEALPEGSYSLVVPSQGGLTDLSGRLVTGPAGHSAGVLASWNVSEFDGPTDSSNLGVLWPGTVNSSGSPVTGSTALAAGQESDYRFVAICDGYYALETQPTTGSADVRVEDGAGATVAAADDLTQLYYFPVMHLTAGVYSLQISPDGPRPTAIEWTLRCLNTQHENLGDNGVGQTPALSLGLVGSTPGGSGAFSPLPSTGGSSGIASLTSVALASAGTSPTATTASPIPAALLVTVETGPVGRRRRTPDMPRRSDRWPTGRASPWPTPGLA